LVADRVVVTSIYDDKQYIWENEADESFIIRKDESGGNFIRRIKVTLYLKEDLSEILEENLRFDQKTFRIC
jgi:HSP90 family molecular chaperone